jgi:hypothetical protein
VVAVCVYFEPHLSIFSFPQLSSFQVDML